MAPGAPAFNPALRLPADRPAAGRRSALVISAAAYGDTQLAWLRPPVSGAADLTAALGDSQAGGFAVQALGNGTGTETRLAISRFLAGRAPDETVLLYLACHAIRDHARLYFAATDTWLSYPQRSAVPADAVLDELDRCPARNRLLILDCCFIGGFAEDRGELDLRAELALDGRGVAVLAGSRFREYSYEGRPTRPELPRSLFTEGLAAGLASGAADENGDGQVSVAEAYGFAYRYVSRYTALQVPQYYLEPGQGELVLSRAASVSGPRPDGQDHPPAHPAAAGRTRLSGPGQDGETDPVPAGFAAVDPRPLQAAARRTGHDTPARHAGHDTPARHAGHGAAARQPGHGGPAGRDGTARRPDRVGAHESGSVRVADVPAAVAPAAPPAGSRDGAPAGIVVEQDKDNAYCVAFSPDGLLLASGGWSRPVRLRDAATGSLVRELKSADSAYDVAFSPDGTALASGGRDGAVGLHDLSGKRAKVRRQTGSPVRALTFSADGGVLISGHEDGVLRLWDLPSLSRRLELSAAGETVYGAACSLDGRLIAAACADGAVRLWRASALDDPPVMLPTHTGWATGVAFSPDGRQLASSGADGLVYLHDPLTLEHTAVLRAGDGIVNAIAVSPDGSYLAAARETGAVTVWEMATSRCATLPGHAGHANDVAFSPDGHLLASAGKDGSVRLWR